MRWSLTDHWEWAWGFKPRFGLIHLDYAAQKLTVKDSGRCCAYLIETNTPPPA